MPITEGTLTRFVEGVWLDRAPIRIVGMPLSSTMTVLDLGAGNMLLHSPIALTPARRAAVEQLGRVAHIYAPNLYHHLHVGDWAAAFPSARVHAPAGLAKKRPDLRIDRIQGHADEPAFAGVIDEVEIEGFRLAERVILHRPSRTLVVADLVHNIGRPAHTWTKIYAGLMGFYDRVALSGMIRRVGFSDREAARRSLDRVLALPFQRVVVGHGDPIADHGPAAIAAAYTWLGVASPEDPA